MRAGVSPLRYFHRDSHRNSIAITNFLGQIKERYAYDAYGSASILDVSGNEHSSVSEGNRWLYTGREWDSALGLFYYRSRMYCPTLGRFIGRDPIGFAGGSGSLYQYVGSNPVCGIDPTGLVGGSDHADDILLGIGPKNPHLSPLAKICNRAHRKEKTHGIPAGTCKTTYTWTRQWIKRRLGYQGPAYFKPVYIGGFMRIGSVKRYVGIKQNIFGLHCTTKGCIGITSALIGKVIKFPRDYGHCFSTLNAAVGFARTPVSKGGLDCGDALNPRGQQAKPAIFAVANYTGQIAQGVTQQINDAGEVIFTVAAVNGAVSHPYGKIFDFAYYLEAHDTFCHANFNEVRMGGSGDVRNDARVKFTTPSRLPFDDNLRPVPTIYCVTCESNELK